MPFVDKSEKPEVSYGREAYRKCIRVGTAACGKSSHGSLEIRSAIKTLGKTYRNNWAPSSRLPNNVEASPRQLGEGETQEMKTKLQTFVYNYDEHARSGSPLTLINDIVNGTASASAF